MRNFGELGDGRSADSDVPVEVDGLPEPVALAAGSEHSLALLKNGNVMAWGGNYYGEVGDGSYNTAYAPVRVCAAGVTECPAGPYLEEVAAISAGARHSLALLKNGTVMAWGSNYEGQLAIASSKIDYSNVPVPVCAVAEVPCKPENYLKEVVAIAAGGWHSLALLKNDTVMAWGYNEEGELGIGTTTGPEKCDKKYYPCSRTPVAVHGLSEVTAIAAGTEHSLALLKNGTVKAWGSNREGKLGDDSKTNSDVPVVVCAGGETAPCATGLSEVASIAGGWGYSLALLKNGTVKSWGGNFEGQLGDGGGYGNGEACDPAEPCGSKVPVAVSDLSEVTAIAAGVTNSGSLALLKGGRVMAWGGNHSGSLGDGDAPTHAAPKAAPAWAKGSVALKACRCPCALRTRQAPAPMVPG